MLTVGMALVVTAIAAFLIRRWLMVPLSSITAAVRRIRAGEAAELTPQGPPELRQVATAVDEMQRTIRQQRDDAIRAREAIEQSAILAVQVRSELTSDLGDYPTGWTMAAGLRPAEGVVAGDCYDVALISPTTIAVIVLDIAGHGAQSAVAALKCKELLKAALRSGLEPGAGGVVAERTGAWPRRALPHRVPRGHRHRQRPGQLRRTPGTPTHSWRGAVSSSGSARRDRSSGPFVTTWETVSMVVDPGAKLIIYTDGLVEARDAGSRLLRRTAPDRPAPGPRLPRCATGRRPHPRRPRRLPPGSTCR